jgi:hypothetical protein
MRVLAMEDGKLLQLLIERGMDITVEMRGTPLCEIAKEIAAPVVKDFCSNTGSTRNAVKKPLTLVRIGHSGGRGRPRDIGRNLDLIAILSKMAVSVLRCRVPLCRDLTNKWGLSGAVLG